MNSLKALIDVLMDLKANGKVLIALLYGSYASGMPHKRSDIDLAIVVKVKNQDEELTVLDKILMSDEREINILRLDDEDESPFIVQEALKGIHLVEPDKECLYKIANRVLHEAEGIRFRRGLDKHGQI